MVLCYATGMPAPRRDLAPKAAIVLSIISACRRLGRLREQATQPMKLRLLLLLLAHCDYTFAYSTPPEQGEHDILSLSSLALRLGDIDQLRGRSHLWAATPRAQQQPPSIGSGDAQRSEQQQNQVQTASDIAAHA